LIHFYKSLQMEKVALECEICREICFRPSRTPCCQTKACRLCALSYVLKNRSCWDCGGKTIHTDIVPQAALRERLENLYPLSPSHPLHCDLCGSIVQKGIRTSCCSNQACRSCARKFVLVNKVCWGEGCPPSEREVWISILETDLHLRGAVQMYRSRGSMDQEILEELYKRDLESTSAPPSPRPRAPPTSNVPSASSLHGAPLSAATYNSGTSSNHSNRHSRPSSNSNSRDSRRRVDADRQKSDDDCVRRGADSSLRGGVDADLRDMTISPDVMDLESEDNQNSYQDEVVVINGDDDESSTSEDEANEPSGNDLSQDGSETRTNGDSKSDPGRGGDWVFINGEGWTLRPSNQSQSQKTSSSWIKDQNGWSVKVDDKSKERSTSKEVGRSAGRRRRRREVQ